MTGGQDPGTQAISLPSHSSNHFPIPHRNRNLQDGELEGRGAELGTGLGSVAGGTSSLPVSARLSGNSFTSHYRDSLLMTFLHFLVITCGFGWGPSPWEEKYSTMSFVGPCTQWVLIKCSVNHSNNKMSPLVEVFIRFMCSRQRTEVARSWCPYAHL